MTWTSVFGDHHIHGPEVARFYTRQTDHGTVPGPSERGDRARKVALHCPTAR